MLKKIIKKYNIAEKSNFYWRVGATGFSFVSFGLGGMAIGLFLTPTLKIIMRDPLKRRDTTLVIIRDSFYCFTEMLRKLGVMTYEIEGIEKLQGSTQEIIIANHPTLIDIVLLIGHMSRANCVVKEKLLYNPFTRGPISNANYIINSDSEKFINDCVHRLQKKGEPSLVIFPEGTRTDIGCVINKFQRGAANIALRTGAAIRPVTITCNPLTLTKSEKWYRIPVKPFHIKMRILDAIDIQSIPLERECSTPKKVRMINHYLQQFFEKELSKDE